MRWKQKEKKRKAQDWKGEKKKKRENGNEIKMRG